MNQTDIAVFRICRCKGNKSAIQRFQRAKIMGGKNQLSLSSLRKNAQKLSEQILKYAGIQFIDRYRDRCFIIYSDQEL